MVLRTLQKALTAAVLLTWASLLAGCGGASSNPAQPRATASVVITIKWPTTASTSRFIHNAADTIRINVSSGGPVASGGTLIATQIAYKSSAPNSTSTITFTSLPLYPVTFTVMAYAHTAPSAILDTTTQNVTLQPDSKNQLTFTMQDQTAKILVLDESGNTISSLTMKDMAPRTLTAVCENAAGQRILSDPTQFSWQPASSKEPLVASISNGVVQPMGNVYPDEAYGNGSEAFVVSELGSPQSQAASTGFTVTIAAPLTWTYTGNPFTSVVNDSGVIAVTFSVTFAKPLPANTTLNPALIVGTATAATFTDGVHTLTWPSSTVEINGVLSTDGRGVITGWWLFALSNPPLTFGGILIQTNYPAETDPSVSPFPGMDVTWGPPVSGQTTPQAMCPSNGKWVAH